MLYVKLEREVVGRPCLWDKLAASGGLGAGLGAGEELTAEEEEDLIALLRKNKAFLGADEDEEDDGRGLHSSTFQLNLSRFG